MARRKSAPDPGDLPRWDDGSRTPRRLGNRPSTRRPPMRGRHVPKVREDELVPFDARETARALEVAFLRVMDQSDIGACNGFAVAESEMYARWRAGYDHVPLSGWWVYGKLTNGIDEGSNISDGLRLLTEVGVCRDSLVPFKEFNPRRFSAEAAADAPRFRAEIGRPLADFDDVLTAANRREAFNMAVAVGGRFNDLDADGVIRGAGAECNHAVSGGYGLKATKRGPAVLLLNHWTEDWGDRGWFWLTRDVFRARWFDAYTILAPEFDPQDPDGPPGL